MASMKKYCIFLHRDYHRSSVLATNYLQLDGESEKCCFSQKKALVSLVLITAFLFMAP
jgi:hypothetical protein